MQMPNSNIFVNKNGELNFCPSPRLTPPARARTPPAAPPPSDPQSSPAPSLTEVECSGPTWPSQHRSSQSVEAQRTPPAPPCSRQS